MNLEEEHKELRGLAPTIAPCTLGVQNSIRTCTGATPYSLVYGMEVVLPIEMGVHSLRTVLESDNPEADWLQSRYDQLCMLDEKRLKVLYHIQGNQRRLWKAFDKKVRTRDLKLRDLVLKEIQAPVQDANRKFKQNWKSPYIIKQIYFGGAVRLMDLDANPFTEPTNMDQLKKYQSKSTMFEVVVNNVISLPRLKKKRKQKQKLARLKTQKGGLGKN